MFLILIMQTEIACLFPRREMYLVIILDSVAFICV